MRHKCHNTIVAIHVPKNSLKDGRSLKIVINANVSLPVMTIMRPLLIHVNVGVTRKNGPAVIVKKFQAPSEAKKLAKYQSRVNYAVKQLFHAVMKD